MVSNSSTITMMHGPINIRVLQVSSCSKQVQIPPLPTPPITAPYFPLCVHCSFVQSYRMLARKCAIFPCFFISYGNWGTCGAPGSYGNFFYSRRKQASLSNIHRGTELGAVEGTRNVTHIKFVANKSQSAFYLTSKAAYFMQLTISLKILSFDSKLFKCGFNLLKLSGHVMHQQV